MHYSNKVFKMHKTSKEGSEAPGFINDDLDKKSLKYRVGYSLYIFGPKNKFRRFIWHFTRHNFFPIATLVVILISMVPMIVETPLSDPDSQII